MPDFCDESATNGNGSQGANFTAGGRELFANQSREAGDSGRVTEALWDSRHSPPDTRTAGRTSRSSRTACPPHTVRQVLIDRLAHGAERGAAIRGECGEVLGHGGSCHVGDDTCCGSGRELYGGRL